MPISLAEEVRRLPAGQLRRPLERWAAAADAVLFSADDRFVAQRIALVTFATRLASAFITYASQILLARWMGDAQYGVFAVVWVGAVVLGGLSCLGFQKAIVRFVPEYVESGRSDLLRGVLIGSRLQALVTAAVAAALGFLGLGVFGQSVADAYVMPLYLAAICLPILAATDVQEGIARAYNWPDLSLWPTFVFRPLLILAFMGGAIAIGRPADATTAMAAVIGATFFSLLGQFLVLERRLKLRVLPGARRFRPMLWIKVALPIFMVEGFFGMMTNIDVLIVGHLLEAEKVAVYFAAVRTMAIVHFVYYAVRAASAHRISHYYNAGDRVRLVGLVGDTLNWTFWPSLAMAALLVVVGEPMLALFGPSFVAGYPLLLIFAVGLLIRASVGPAESLLAMSNHQGICALVFLAAFLVNVGLNFAFVPHFGLAGAAVATATALLVEAAGLFFAAWYRLGIKCSIFFALGSRTRLSAVVP